MATYINQKHEIYSLYRRSMGWKHDGHTLEKSFTTKSRTNNSISIKINKTFPLPTLYLTRIIENEIMARAPVSIEV